MPRSSPADLDARFAAILHDMAHEDHLRARLGEAARVVLGADAASLRLGTFSAPDEVEVDVTDQAHAFEQLQDLVDAGPSSESRRGQIQSMSMSEPPPDRWNAVHDLALRSGFTGEFWAVPVQSMGIVLGVLTLYRENGPLSETFETVQAVADAVGTSLLDDPRLDGPDQHLNGTWPERSRIYQAAGVVVAQLGIAAEDAVAVLRANAYANELPLLEVAVRVLESRLSFADRALDG